MSKQKEIFKDIPNYNGLYQVSNLGNVKSLKFNKEKLLSRVLTPVGYYVVNISLNKKQKTVNVHQLVAITFLNHKPNGHKLVVDHINNIRTDNRLKNIQLITNRENSSKDKKNKTSKYTGVYLYKKYNNWRAQIKINGTPKYIGYFINEYDAHLAYQKELNKLSQNL